jgi:tRNA dimethylallyltransferase
MNTSDAERLAAVLESMNHKQTPNINEADLIYIVMCSVRQSAVDRVYGILEKIKKFKKRPKIILTGCILPKDKNKFLKKFDEIVDINNLINFKITPKYSSNKTAYVPIMTGCNNFCSYCVVPYTRGREISYQAEKIIAEVKNLVNPPLPTGGWRGKKEIWLLGQNVNSYKNKNFNFPKLLKKIDEIPGDFVLNFTTSHPKDFSDELIETMKKCKKLSTDLNLPIQSGDDEVLKKMNRPYTVAQYKTLVKKIREALPQIRLSTDIIVGFPGETKKQFNNTVKTIKQIGYGVAFINKYSPREGTAAAKLEDNVPWKEKKRREKILIDLINAKKNLPAGQAGKLLVILGPTACGKTDLSIKISKKYNGEVVSADSRQVYKELDIGSGKITKKEMQNIPHYLLDVANPKTRFTVAKYQKLALKTIKNIQKRGKLPILVGGTGFYIQSIVDGISIPEVSPNWKLRKILKKKSNEYLYKMLLEKDPKRARTIDKHNPRRLIRALEIVMSTQKPVPELKQNSKANNFEILQIGINKSTEELKKNIKKRLLKRLKNNALINEVKNLHKSGLSWKRLEEFGLEYKFVAQYLQNKITRQEMINKIQIESEHFAKRQMTWFKRDKRIHWIKNYKEAEKLIKIF